MNILSFRKPRPLNPPGVVYSSFPKVPLWLIVSYKNIVFYKNVVFINGTPSFETSEVGHWYTFRVHEDQTAPLGGWNWSRISRTPIDLEIWQVHRSFAHILPQSHTSFRQFTSTGTQLNSENIALIKEEMTYTSSVDAG